MRITLLAAGAVLGLAAVSALNSCTYHTAADLYPDLSLCDTAAVTYSGSIVPILATNCNGCHNAQDANGGIVLDSHQDVVQYVDNGLLLCTIKRESDCSEMPPDTEKIPACDILIIQRWIQDGALDN